MFVEELVLEHLVVAVALGVGKVEVGHEFSASAGSVRSNRSARVLEVPSQARLMLSVHHTKFG